MLARLREALPDDVVLVVTGDHGMVDVPPGTRSSWRTSPSCWPGWTPWRVRGGSGSSTWIASRRPRSRPGGPTASATRPGCGPGRRPIEEGWFGPVDPDLVERWGHVLVALRTDWAVMTQQFPRELSLVGMHGSLTEAEMTVPLLIG